MRGTNPGAGLLAVAVFLVTVFWTLALSGGLPDPNEAHLQQAQHEPQPKAAETGSADDRLANYTWWLTAFTGLLAAVSGVQGWLLIRADRAATIAADRNQATTAKSMELREKQFALAANQNKISETAQRAWIKIESVKLISPTAIPNLDLVPNPDEERFRLTKLVVQVVVRNIGRSPASQLNISSTLLEPIGSELRPHVANIYQVGRFAPGEGGSVLLPDDREIRTFEFWGPLPRICFQDQPTPHLVLALKVCATYRIGTDIDTHTTQFAYRDAVRIIKRIDDLSLTRDGRRDSDPT